MKTTIGSLALAAMTSACLLTGAPRNVRADDHPGRWDENHHYYVDDHGYWDEHDKYHKFLVYKEKHGYWDTRGDKKVFITVKTW